MGLSAMSLSASSPAPCTMPVIGPQSSRTVVSAARIASPSSTSAATYRARPPARSMAASVPRTSRPARMRLARAPSSLGDTVSPFAFASASRASRMAGWPSADAHAAGSSSSAVRPSKTKRAFDASASATSVAAVTPLAPPEARITERAWTRGEPASVCAA